MLEQKKHHVQEGQAFSGKRARGHTMSIIFCLIASSSRASHANLIQCVPACATSYFDSWWFCVEFFLFPSNTLIR